MITVKSGRRMLVLACLLLVSLPPAAAYAATQFDYASGVNGINGFYATTGYADRNYNQVWHQAGREWEVWYDNTFDAFCVVDNTNNPTKCPSGLASAKAHAANFTDNSGVTWTAQTTRP